MNLNSSTVSQPLQLLRLNSTAFATQQMDVVHLFPGPWPEPAAALSLIDPLPHQQSAVYDVVLKQPRLRFLLADNAGAGNTIMVGLYMRELLSRRLIQRALVVPPAALKRKGPRPCSATTMASDLRGRRSTPSTDEVIVPLPREKTMRVENEGRYDSEWRPRKRLKQCYGPPRQPSQLLEGPDRR